MKTLGVLGGMTYHSATLYYSRINEHVNQKLGGASSAQLIIHSLNHAEVGSYFQAGQWDLVADKLVAAAKHMKDGGAQAVAIANNLAHKAADELEALSGLPLLHIADFAAAAIRDQGLTKVALLATSSVMEDDFFKRRLREQAAAQKEGSDIGNGNGNMRLEVLVPDQEDRKVVNDVVFQELANGVFKAETRAVLKGIVQKLVEEQGAQGVVLACTELGFVVKQEDLTVPVFETMELHSKGLAEWMLVE